MANRGLGVALPAPLDVVGSLALFRRPGDDGIDRWDGQTLRRVLPLDDLPVPFAARATGTIAAPGFVVTLPAGTPVEVRAQVAAAVGDTFTAPPPEYAELLAAEPVLAELDRRFPGIRQIRQLDLFTALIRCISAQQVNLRWASTTRRRLAEAFGTPYTLDDGEIVYRLDPVRLAAVDPAAIRALQFTTSKAASIVAVAQTLVVEGLTSARLELLNDEDVVATLTRIKGIGRWSAEWVLARTLGRPCVVAGDLGVRKAVGLAYGLEPLPSEAEVRAFGARWGASAGLAQALLLHALGEGALTPARPESRRRSR
jgi:DNA-3-methyladenine glycosylase II